MLMLYLVWELAFAAAAEAFFRTQSAETIQTKCNPPDCVPYSHPGGRLKRGELLMAEMNGVNILQYLRDPYDNNLSTPALEVYLASLEAAATAARNRSLLAHAPETSDIAFTSAPEGIRMCSTFYQPTPKLQQLVVSQLWFCCEGETATSYAIRPVCYQKMPKAASSSMHSALKRLYRNCSVVNNNELNKTQKAPPGSIFVTSTRNPWTWIRAAYAEIDGWMYSIGDRPRRPWDKTKFYHMSRRDEPARFLAFLDDIFNQRFGATRFFDMKTNQSAPNVFYAAHAHPQLSQVLNMPVIHAIVRQEAMEHDWARLELLLGVPPERRVIFTQTNVAGMADTIQMNASREERTLIRKSETGNGWGGSQSPWAILMKKFHKTQLSILDYSVEVRGKNGNRVRQRTSLRVIQRERACAQASFVLVN
jgi:hypothetical protein